MSSKMEEVAHASLWLAVLAISAGSAGCKRENKVGVAPAPPDAGWVIPNSSMPQQLQTSVYPSSVPPHPLAEELCAALHRQPGKRVAECCGGDVSEFLMLECNRLLAASLHTGLVTLDAGAVAHCAVETAATLAGCDWVTPSQPRAAAACQGIIKGTLAEGKVCRSSLDCVGNLHCDGAGPTRTGLCAPPQPSGASCGGGVDALAAYTGQRDLDTSRPPCAEFCSLQTHKCQPWAEPGDACFTNLSCAANQACVSGKCKVAPRSKVGQPCTSVLCDAGLLCISGTCVALKKTGEPCRTDFDCAVGGCQKESGELRCGKKCSAVGAIGAIASGDAGASVNSVKK